MTSEEQILRAWLVGGGADGVPFLEDLWLMLGARARRSTAREVTRLLAGDSLDLRASVSTQVGEALAAEIGLHRAQFVPQHSQVGRVATAMVAVELLLHDQAASVGRPDGAILRTYNYPLGQVVVHASGQHHALAAVLSGDAG